MASYSSLGIGAGVDLQGMLTKIMDAERIPMQMLESRISVTEAKFSAYGTLKSALSSLQAKATSIRFDSSLQARSVTSSDSEIAGATAFYNAAQGTYQLNVTQLASAQKSFSTEYASGTTFDSGDLNFTVAGEAKVVTLSGQTSYTLEEVAQKINDDKIGVTASVVTTSSGAQRLIFSGNETGDAHDFSLSTSVAASGSQASLADFDTSTPGLARSSAQNSVMSIDGIEVTSASNTFTAAITGLTITASKTGSSTLTVATDTDKVTATAEAFVTALNSVINNIKTNSAYDSTAKTSGVFSGDSTARSILDRLQSARTTEPAGVASSQFKTLADLGITIQQNGELSLDATRFKEALGTSTTDVIKTLNAYGAAFGDSVGDMLAADGIVGTRSAGLSSTINRFQDDKEALQIRLDMIEKRYRAQFTALDKLVSSMQTTSSYLGQTLAQMQSSSS